MRLANQFQSLSLDLAKGELLSCIETKTKLEVSCLRGALWITSENQAGDVILRAGEVAVMPPGPLVVVQALESAAVRIADGSAHKEA
jgi:hypothetical protein